MDVIKVGRVPGCSLKININNNHHYNNNSASQSPALAVVPAPSVAETEDEREAIVRRVKDAIKAVQLHFTSQVGLATSADARVATLIAQLESAFVHGLKSARRRQAEVSFWPMVRELLESADVVHYTCLKNITTDSGRGRAWLRTALNEQLLQSFFERIEKHQSIVRQYYDDYALLLDHERAHVFAMLFQGLESTHFALEVDTSEINAPRYVTRSASVGSGAAAASNGLATTISPVPASTGIPDADGLDEGNNGEDDFVREHSVTVVNHDMTILKTKKRSKKKKVKKRPSISEENADGSDTAPASDAPSTFSSIAAAAPSMNDFSSTVARPAESADFMGSIEEGQRDSDEEVDFANMTAEELSAHVEDVKAECSRLQSELATISDSKRKLQATLQTTTAAHQEAVQSFRVRI
ncbi:uncharacterized protein MONBRDRAFT_29927 [Monosiga brevicollis MX1]|uniref:RUN domain-containing protein n=1 Tax=Monosiga brevicollis TaxID=81824 RepID=A9VCI8_MONBE|nr:uncharacterized protein MONBRDRAFT_29927 [Monosiga brevicollis MX1]EDQ84793.1 predicted protein [Monosiga brevicollis MX1]|eukprot:XP_001750443.1 hypothetical protein [Monosiga brevicollis MX1]